MLNLREINGILIQSFFKNIFACNIFDPYICAVLCIVEHAKRPQLYKTNVLSYNLFIHKSEWDWVLQGHQGARRGGELRKVIRGR